MNRHEVHLLSGAYALHAATPEERAVLEQAMAESEELRSEVIGLVDTAVTLGLAVPPVAPPPALRSALLARIQDLPQEAPLDSEDEPEPVVTITDARRHVAPHRRPRLRRRPALLLGAAALALVLFGGGVLVQRALIEPQLEYSQVLAAADVHHVTAPVRGGGTADVSWSASEQATAVALKGVSVPSGRVLQLWRVRGGSITSAGLYGQYEVLHDVPTAGEQLAVSVEPAGGSKQPTTTPIARVALTA